MFKIGAHLSVAGGYLNLAKEAASIDANTFQYFSRNPRGGSRRALDLPDISAVLAYLKAHNFQQFLAHAPYTLNACSADSRTREFTEMAMRDDLQVMQNLPNNLYNFHPGSHTGQGIEAGITMISEMLNKILWSEMSTTVLLEAMSGKGSEVGSDFLELKEIIARVELNHKMGVCIDTCHLYSAGYDIVNNLDGVLEQFDKSVGISKLKAVHLNDSMTPYLSHKDRHETIGNGSIGLDAIVRIINHPLLRELPFFLETPLEAEGHKKEIALLKSLYNG